MTDTQFKPGLEGVVAAETRLSSVDGSRGELVVGGFVLEELAPRAAFEEVAYLLLYDELPTPAQFDAFRAQLAAARTLPAATEALLRSASAAGVPPMSALVMAAPTLAIGLPDDREGQAVSLLAKLPSVVASYWRFAQGLDAVAPNQELGFAANYLYMLAGSNASPSRERGMETYLNTVVDHGLNASTFTARVIISTHSDLVSAVTGAIGALKGPLHGGAPGPALDMVFEIGKPDRAEPVIREKLERGDRLMGFGHRVYKVRDPRADVLSAAAREMYEADGDVELYRLATHVEGVALAELERQKPGRHLQTNVEFYTALLLHGLGLPAPLFTPTFAIARAAGWIAHCFEQLDTGRLMRPESVYVGRRREWVPLAER